MSNPCGFTASSYQDLADILCTVYTNLNGQLDSIKTDTLQIARSLGVPGYTPLYPSFVADSSGVGVDALTQSVKDDVASFSDGAFPYLIAINNTVNNISGAVIPGSGDSLLTQIGNTLSKVGNILTGIAFSFEQTDGGQLAFDLGAALQSLLSDPPDSLLTYDGPTAIPNGTPLEWPTGAYTIKIELSVPPTWGQLGGNPAIFIPAPARIARVADEGDMGRPQDIQVFNSELRRSSFNESDVIISLGPGVTGNYWWGKLFP